MAAKKKNVRTRLKRSERKNIAVGQAHIKSTFNNTIVTHHRPVGQRDLLAVAPAPWASRARASRRRSPRSWPPRRAAKMAQEHGLRKVAVFVKGPGSGRETAIRSLQAAGLEIASIQDCTPVPHNGCRPRKRRRV